MKKTLALLLALSMLIALAACGGGTAPTADQTTADKPDEEAPGAEPTAEENPGGETPAEEPPTEEAPADEAEIVVFAAASMTETLTELKAEYEAAHPGVTVVYSFGSSGDLSKQIKRGAACDLFISAGQKQMNQLDVNASPEVNTDGSDYVVDGSRVDLLENKVVLVVPEGNPKGIEGFEQLAGLLAEHDVFMAMGGVGVPVGEYTQKILAFYGLDEEELANAGCITYGADVKEVTTHVSKGNVDCGVVYGTDAYSAGLTVLEGATPEMCGQIIYPAAVIRSGQNPAAAGEFLAFLQTEEAMAVFEKVGFSPVA